MTDAAKGYLVRDAEATGGKGRKVDQIYPYTLRGLTEALEEARFRSHSGSPQVLAILGTGNTKVIRRFEDGREVPVAPLADPLAAATGGPQLGADRADGGDRRRQPRREVLAVAGDEDRVPDRVDARDRPSDDRRVRSRRSELGRDGDTPAEADQADRGADALPGGGPPGLDPRRDADAARQPAE